MTPFLHELIGIFLAFGTVFGTIWAGAQFIRVKTSQAQIFLALVSISCAALTCFNFFALRSMFSTVTFFNYGHIPFLFLAGPSLYFFFLATLENEFKFERRRLLHFMPAVVILLSLPVSYLFSPSLFPTDPLAYFAHGQAGYTEILFALGIAALFFYAYLLFIRARRLFSFRLKKNKKAVRLFVSIFVFTGTTCLAALWAVLAKSFMLINVSGLMIVSALIFIFLFSYRYPAFFSDIGEELGEEDLQDKLVKFQAQTLKDVDPLELHIRLTELMLDKKMFEDEDLNINTVARELDLKPYQLSEFLNNYLSVNFAQFVKSYRINEAKHILVDEPDANILSVAYRVGFNSKTTFNVSFKNLTGMTPREYVKQARQSNTAS